MKRLSAILMGCMLITGTFASCGSSGSSSGSETSAETSASEETDALTEENSGEETTAAKPEKTTSAATEADTSRTTTAKKTSRAAVTDEKNTTEPDPSNFHGGDISGMWLIDDEDIVTYLEFDSGHINMAVDLTDEIEFSDDTVSFEGVSTPYSFDGKTLKIIDNETNEELLILKKDSGSSDSLEGIYKFSGGTNVSYFTNDSSGIKYDLLIRDGKTFAWSKGVFTYETDGNTLTLTPLFANGVTVNNQYDVSGNTLRLLTEDGDVNTAARVNDF